MLDKNELIALTPIRGFAALSVLLYYFRILINRYNLTTRLLQKRMLEVLYDDT